MKVEKKVTSIALTTSEERDLIETIFEMAKTIRPGYGIEDDEFLKAVGFIVKDLKEYKESDAVEY